MGRVLIVDDEPHMRRILVTSLARDKHVVTEACGLEEARNLLASSRFDAVVTDQKMPDGDGLEVLARLRELDPSTAVVILTAYATVELAVESMRKGAFDFVTKPFQTDVLRAAVRRACEHTALLRENGVLRQTLVKMEGPAEIIGISGAMAAVRETVARVAPTGATVLIQGETGTGKEVAARAIHRMSLRALKPFIAVNCASITESLLEAELFGHEKGAFTGAERTREGLFEAANEGTLFLDEVGDMSLTAQAKLLRVLMDGQIMRVGSTRGRSVDVRVLVATNRDLEAAVRQGRFRQDLYYRLAVVPVHIPPLRERPEDIPGLCALFCRLAARELKQPLRPLSVEAIRKLRRYSFPGNVRELKNLIERALILSSGCEVGPDQLLIPAEESKPERPAEPRDTCTTWVDLLPESVNLRSIMESVERDLIDRALRSSGGVRAEAARRLGLSRSELAYKLGKPGNGVLAGPTSAGSERKSAECRSPLGQRSPDGLNGHDRVYSELVHQAAAAVGGAGQDHHPGAIEQQKD